MKNRLFTTLLTADLLLTSFTALAKGSITVEITNLRNAKGHVLITLYDKSEGFPEKGAKTAAGKTKVSIQNGKAIATFDNMPAGNYAVATMHDENDNVKMDFNILHMPKEGYGFSNDAKGTMGPPSFKDASFQHNGEDKKVTLKMTYFMD
jgi:uncharacterized protein (DUF2141 family)